MDDGPFSAFPDPHGDGLHDAAAAGGAVARLLVHMEAAQAVAAMVSVAAPGVVKSVRPKTLPFVGEVRQKVDADLAAKCVNSSAVPTITEKAAEKTAVLCRCLPFFGGRPQKLLLTY